MTGQESSLKVSGGSNPAPSSRGTHTPTPWAVRDSHAELAALGLKKESDWVEVMANGGIVASCYMLDEAGNEANAAFIVRAVNNHDALVKALRKSDDLIRDAQYILEKHLYPDASGDASETVNELLELLDGARQREVQAATRAVLKAAGA